VTGDTKRRESANRTVELQTCDRLRLSVLACALLAATHRAGPCDWRIRAGIEAAAEPAEPSPASCAARPRACGAGNPRAGTRIGPAENVSVCVPVIETPEHVAAAELATRELNAPYLTAIMEGRYLESFLAAAGADAPKVAAEDMNAIGTPVDFVGLNVYLPGHYVSASDAAPGFVSVPFPAKYPMMNSSWLKIGPEALYWGPRNVAKVWHVRDIYITENGCSATDVPAADGLVYDTDRIMFLRSYLMHLQRATSEGVPVRGYFHWSLMDNFEWADGFGTRFGVFYVDYATQQRTPKLSASFYREVAARNRLV
jgi:beta-glucosidase